MASAALLVLTLCLGSDRRDARGFVAGAAILCPAAAINALGQNAFLTSALLVGGFRLSRVRPVLAGGVLGTLTIKPQFWLLVPVALIAAGEWRVLIASLASATMLAAVSAWVFGIDAWSHWFSSTTASMGSDGAWTRYARLWGDSVYACLTGAGASPMVANIAQAGAILLAAVAVVAAFRRSFSGDERLAVVLAAVILAAPHSSIYDKVMLSVAAALWVSAKDVAPMWKWILSLGLWLAPLLNPPLLLLIGRLTPALVLMFIGAVLGEAASRRPDRFAMAPAGPVSG
jgi:hypothetical protein